MEHILKLQPKYFDYINNGTKRVELRLYDEKRQKINIGDTIIFQKEPELEITMKVKVIGLLRYNTFEELFEDFDIEMLADKSMTKQELLNVLEEFYTPEKQKQYVIFATYKDNSILLNLNKNGKIGNTPPYQHYCACIQCRGISTSMPAINFGSDIY